MQGVVRALLEQGVLPRIIAGSSVGSIVAAIIAVHTDEELKVMYTNMDNFNLSFFSNSTSFESIHHLLTKGTLQDISYLIERLRALLGDLTFVDVFERTGTALVLSMIVCPISRLRFFESCDPMHVFVCDKTKQHLW